MKLTGWALIVIFGGAWVFFALQWLYRWLTGYFVNPEQWAALAWIGLFGLIAAIPAGIGILLVYRASRADFPSIERD